MSMDVTKICRTCLALNGPLLSIFDGLSEGSGSSCVADMLKGITNMKPRPDDNMPEKVCLACISEINRCYSFKMKCENSNKTLRQLLPDAKDEIMHSHITYEKVSQSHKAIQTLPELEGVMDTEQAHQGIQTELFTSDFASSPPGSSICEEDDESDVLKIEKGFVVDQLPEEERDECKMQVVCSTDVSTGEASSNNREISLKRRRYSSNGQDEIVFELSCNEREINSVQSSETAYGTLSETGATDTTAYYVVSETQPHENEEGGYESDNFSQENDYTEDGSTVPINDYNFTIINTEEGEEEIAASKSPSRTLNEKSKRKRKLKTAIKRAELKCPDCTMTFVSLKNLRRHCFKMHQWSQRELNKLQALEAKGDEAADDGADGAATENAHSSLIRDLIQDGKVEMLVDAKTIEAVNTADTTVTVDGEPASASQGAQRTVHCPRCNAGFAYSKSLNYHMKLNQCTAKTFTCSDCQRVFSSKSGLEKHRLTHLLQHSCSECTMVFKNKNELSQHMIGVHNRSIRNQCNICKKVFTMLSALKDHLRIHSGEKPFLCQTCGKAFRQNANLKQHVMRHSQVKPYKCDECPVSFVSKAELYSHKRTHSGDHPFKCDSCNSCYTTSSSLVKHRRKHTGERPYACEFCPMRFSALNVLKNHRRTHTGEKPYVCIFCNKGFTQKSDCQIHQRTHTGEKRYTCHCGSSFTHLSTMRVHLKQHDKSPTKNGSSSRKRKATSDDECFQEITTVTILENGEFLQKTETDAEGSQLDIVGSDGDELIQIAMEDM